MAKVKPMKTAVIGCGMISDIYLKNLKETFSIIDLVGCADMVEEKAKAQAEKYEIRHMTTQEILEDPEIELVLNLTYALSHFEVSKAVLEAGKHLYCEKMMGVNMGQAAELMKLTACKQVRFAVAPDTFLGGSMQTARFAVDSGMIGQPVFGVAKLARGYHMVKNDEDDAKRLYSVMRPGAGIPYDMGGYYLHEMFSMFGPVSRASGFCFTRGVHRPYLNPNHARFREDFFVETPNTLTAALEFRNGFYASMAMSSDCFGGDNLFEIHGTDGTLSVGDPNNFGDPVYITRNGGEKTVFPMTHPYCENSRGIGAAELAWSVRAERPHRLSAEMGYHALEIIEALQVCTRDNQTKLFDTDFQRPRALSTHWVDHPQCKELVLAD